MREGKEGGRGEEQEEGGKRHFAFAPLFAGKDASIRPYPMSHCSAGRLPRRDPFVSKMVEASIHIPRPMESMRWLDLTTPSRPRQPSDRDQRCLYKSIRLEEAVVRAAFTCVGTLKSVVTHALVFTSSVAALLPAVTHLSVGRFSWTPHHSSRAIS